jgi:uncharacterized protein YjbI with pentapeptide repeats
LEGADLSSAKLSLTNLSRANLRNTNLRGAIFGGTDLSDADLRGADLRGTSLDSSYHKGAQFDGEFIATKPYANSSENEVEKEVFIADPAKPKQLPETREVKVGERRDLEGPSPPVIVDRAVKPPSGEVKNQEMAKESKPSLSSLPLTAPIAKKVVPVQQAIIDVPPQAEKISTGSPAAPMAVKDDAKKQVAVEPTVSTPVVTPKVNAPEQKTESAAGLPATQPAAQAEAKKEPIPEPAASASAKKTDQESSKVTAVAKMPAKSQPEVAKENNKTSSPPQEKVVKTAKTAGEKPSKEGPVIASNQDPPVARTKEENLLRLLDKKKCYGCDLSGLDLSGKNLDGVDLEKANLTGCNLEKADLEDANLKGVLLLKANLRQANVQNTDFYKADLTGADFTGAKVEGAMFDSAQTASALGLKEAVGAAGK